MNDTIRIMVQVERTAEDNVAWAERFIADRRWQEAVTYRETAPHEYTIRGWLPDSVAQEGFFRFVRVIRHHGYPAMFWKSRNMYLDVGAYRYWTMGAPVEETEVINRQPIAYEQRGFRRLGDEEPASGNPTDTVP